MSEVIPIFISLPQFSTSLSTGRDLVADALLSFLFTSDEINSLQQNRHLLFIMDGLDEVAIDSLPKHNFLAQTQLTKWMDKNRSKMVLMCRTQHLPILESKVGVSLHFLLTTPTAANDETLESCHLMPFSSFQIKQFLEGYSQSNEDQSSDWTSQEYAQLIDNIQGLSSLIQTPFLLKLIVKILPQLINTKVPLTVSMHAPITPQFTTYISCICRELPYQDSMCFTHSQDSSSSERCGRDCPKAKSLSQQTSLNSFNHCLKDSPNHSLNLEPPQPGSALWTLASKRKNFFLAFLSTPQKTK
jgi:hypothetical protein